MGSQEKERSESRREASGVGTSLSPGKSLTSKKQQLTVSVQGGELVTWQPRASSLWSQPEGTSAPGAAQRGTRSGRGGAAGLARSPSLSLFPSSWRNQKAFFLNVQPPASERPALTCMLPSTKQGLRAVLDSGRFPVLPGPPQPVGQPWHRGSSCPALAPTPAGEGCRQRVRGCCKNP